LLHTIFVTSHQAVIYGRSFAFYFLSLNKYENSPKGKIQVLPLAKKSVRKSCEFLTCISSCSFETENIVFYQTFKEIILQTIKVKCGGVICNINDYAAHTPQ